MSGRQARSLCPGAIEVEPRFSAYTEASKAVFEVFEHTTPLVEGISIDEAFLDVGGLRRVSGTPTEIATRLRHDVLERVGLRITVGVGRTKFLAKVASGVAKPDGLLLVPPDRELAFLHPLAVERLWGVGPVTAEKLHNRGIKTVGEVARLPEVALVSMLGLGQGRHLHALAHNRDPSRCRSVAGAGSIGSQRALGRSPKTPGSARRGGGAARRSRHSPDAGRVACRSDRRAPLALRRLLARDAIPHARAHHLAHTDDPRDGTSTADRGHAAHRAPGRHADRRVRRQSRPRRRDPARPAVRSQRVGARSMRPSTACGTGSDRPSVTRAASLGQDPGWSIPMLPD
jgi:DNA polymerase-4